MMFERPSAPLVLLVSLAFGVTDAIRTLKEGPMIDAEGREYKTALLAEDRPGLSDGPAVRVECTEASMIVSIQADFYRNGRLVSPEELFLGDAEYWSDSQCQAAAAGEHGHVIEAGLQNCGSKLSISEDEVIYSNHLIFLPAVSHHTITRMAHAVVPVSCHYKRTHTVSSSAQQQQQALTFSKSAKFSGSSPFSLKLMTGDWTTQLFSSTFNLGDHLHLEASYTGPDARRLFVDGCVATLTPDASSVPRYYFIENQGCFTDSKGGSSARFLPRRRADSLQLQLEAFLFHNDLRNTVFITCQLKATPQMWQNSPSNKACSYLKSSWKNVDGYDGVCQCCDSVCHRSPPTNDIVCDTVTLGPLIILPSK